MKKLVRANSSGRRSRVYGEITSMNIVKFLTYINVGNKLKNLLRPKLLEARNSIGLKVCQEVRPYWMKMLLLLLISLIEVPMALLTPIPLAIIVDNIFGDKSLDYGIFGFELISTKSRLFLLVLSVIIFLAVNIGGPALRMIVWYMGEVIGEKMVLRFRSKLFKHAQELSASRHASKGSADATYRIQWDAPAIQWLFIWNIIPIIISLVTVSAMIVTAARISAKLTTITLVVCPFVVALVWYFGPKLKLKWKNVKHHESLVLATISEMLRILPIINAFGQQKTIERRYIDQSKDALKLRLGVVKMDIVFTFLMTAIMSVGTVIVLVTGVNEVSQGKISIGQLIIVFGYVSQIYSPIQSIGKSFAEIQGSIVSLRRAYELLDEKSGIEESRNALVINRARGKIDFKDVTFAYDNKIPLLKNISFTVPSGATVGIIGSTGSGKSTILKLLMRICDPTDGEILLDGLNIKELTLDSLRHQFTVMMQDPYLLKASIADNIRFSKLDASMEDIVRVSKLARVENIVKKLPNGYETVIGEAGSTLSGGEQQRISMARAFLRDTPILIFDEPTSNLDSQTESHIIADIKKSLEDKTVFIVTHRPSGLMYADIILEVRNNTISQIK